MKFLTIVPSTGKRNRWLDQCLESLKTQSHPTDVDIMFDYGLSYARNVSVKRNLNKYDAFAFIDDDAIADERWIEELEKAMNKSDIVGGLILPKYAGTPPFWFSQSLHPFIAINPVSHHIYGCNMAVRREVFRVGFFREDLGRAKDNLAVGEETEFLQTAFVNGFSVSFGERAIVYHLISKEKLTAKYILKRFYWEGKSNSHWQGRNRTIKARLFDLIKRPQQLRFLPFHIAYIGGALSCK